MFQNEDIESSFVNPQDVDIFIDKDDRKSVLVENEYTIIPDFVIPRVGSGTTYYQKVMFDI